MPCNGIHTFFMRFPIDAVFMDKKGSVVKIYKNLPPWRVTWNYWKVSQVLELDAGESDRLGLTKSEVLHLCKED